jgi:hypothetical protein
VDARTEEFLAHVQSGGLVETGDWMPDEYRARLTKFFEMHANSDLMGVLPERDWFLRAPTARESSPSPRRSRTRPATRSPLPRGR